MRLLSHTMYDVIIAIVFRSITSLSLWLFTQHLPCYLSVSCLVSCWGMTHRYRVDVLEEYTKTIVAGEDLPFNPFTGLTKLFFREGVHCLLDTWTANMIEEAYVRHYYRSYLGWGGVYTHARARARPPARTHTHARAYRRTPAQSN